MSRSGSFINLIILTLTFVFHGSDLAFARVGKLADHTGVILLTPETRSYPNRMRIKAPESIDEAATVTLYSISGARLLETTILSGAARHSSSIDDFRREFSGLASGYYFYRSDAARTTSSAPAADSLLFQDVSTTHLPGQSTRASVSHFGDLNGDGYPDLIISADAVVGQPQVLINDRAGRFVNETAARMPTGEFFTFDILLLDVDKDDDLDIYFVAEDMGNQIMQSADRLFLNDGSGHFTDVSDDRLPTLPTLSNRAAWGFIDDDTFPDLVVTGLVRQAEPFHSSIFVLMNDGAGQFADESTAYLPALEYGVFDVAIADINGDERQDIILANLGIAIAGESDPTPVFVYNGQNAVLVQNNTGQFVDETSARMPVENEPGKLVTTADINNDGMPEIYVINNSFLTDVHHQLFLNTGNGVFENATGTRLPSQPVTFLNDAVFQDFDSNGGVDLYLVNVNPSEDGPAAPDFLNLNDSGFLVDASDLLPQRFDFSVSAASADIDGDSDCDVFVSNGDGFLGAVPDKLLQNQTMVVSVRQQPAAAPSGFVLAQNYPNPFNPTTTIHFYLETQSHVRLTIYDILGNQLSTLLDAQRPAGDHILSWQAKDLTTGVYFYRLEIDGHAVATRKALLLK